MIKIPGKRQRRALKDWRGGEISWCEEGTRADLVSVELVHDLDKEAQGGAEPERMSFLPGRGPFT